MAFCYRTLGHFQGWGTWSLFFCKKKGGKFHRCLYLGYLRLWSERCFLSRKIRAKKKKKHLPFKWWLVNHGIMKRMVVPRIRNRITLQTQIQDKEQFPFSNKFGISPANFSSHLTIPSLLFDGSIHLSKALSPEKSFFRKPFLFRG